MEKTITFNYKHREITFSDFDKDEEIEVVITGREDNYFWLTKENVMSLKKHIDYLASKI